MQLHENPRTSKPILNEHAKDQNKFQPLKIITYFGKRAQKESISFVSSLVCVAGNKSRRLTSKCPINEHSKKETPQQKAVSGSTPSQNVLWTLLFYCKRFTDRYRTLINCTHKEDNTLLTIVRLIRENNVEYARQFSLNTR